MKKIVTLMAVSVFLLASAWAGEGWETDFSKAKARAAEKNLPILIDFTGSDWCGWCIRLDDEVFSQAAFKKYAKENLVLFIADFPQSKPQSAKVRAQNKILASKYGIRGYPTIILVDIEGKVLGTTGYKEGGPVPYIKHIKALLSKAKK